MPRPTTSMTASPSPTLQYHNQRRVQKCSNPPCYYQFPVSRHSPHCRGLLPTTISTNRPIFVFVIFFICWMSAASLVVTSLSFSPSPQHHQPQQSTSKGTVLVTGSTDGIGLTTAKYLASNGFNVLVHGKDEIKIRSAIQTITTFCAKQQRDRSNRHIKKQQQRSTLSSSSSMDVLNDCAGTAAGSVVPLPARDISTIEGCVRLTDDVKATIQNHGLSLTVLLHNAGVYCPDYQPTRDGLEMTFAVNVLAPFVITSYLLSSLLQQPPSECDTQGKKRMTGTKNSRIIIVSSISQSRTVRDWSNVAGEQYNTNTKNSNTQYSYSAHGSYSESKLLDAMLTMEMSSQLQQQEQLIAREEDPTTSTTIAANTTTVVVCNCLDPGTVNTKMLLAGWGRIGIDVEDALDEVWLCGGSGGGNIQHSSSDNDTIDIDIDRTGQYFVSRLPRRAATSAYDRMERDRLWQVLTRLAPEAAKEWDMALSAY
jgi:NAD(P)-dependent dehydrogenase (short-subunit alcohol dehydrogenase family)